MWNQFGFSVQIPGDLSPSTSWLLSIMPCCPVSCLLFWTKLQDILSKLCSVHRIDCLMLLRQPVINPAPSSWFSNFAVAVSSTVDTHRVRANISFSTRNNPEAMVGIGSPESPPFLRRPVRHFSYHLKGQASLTRDNYLNCKAWRWLLGRYCECQRP